MYIRWVNAYDCNTSLRTWNMQLKLFLGAGDYSQITNFNMSMIKPQLPGFLYAAWSYISQNREMMRRSWDACGLRGMYDDRRAGLVKKAKLALHDEENAFFPLFPNKDSKAIPVGAADGEFREPSMPPLVQPCSNESVEEESERLHAEEPQVAEHVDAAVEEHSEESGGRLTGPAKTSAPVPGQRICPLFLRHGGKKRS